MKITILLTTLVAATIVMANQNSNERGGQREMREPPQEAISICEGQSEGNSCSVTSPRGDTLEGTCKNTPDEKYFACIPKNRRPQ
jgi:hypothetical protein